MSEAALGSVRDRAESRWFYAWIAVTALVIAVVGFMPTYFVPILQGQSIGEPIQHIHGILFFGWCLLFCMQTWLVARGGVLAHRNWGMLGIALATAMVISVLVTVAVRINAAEPMGVASQARSFAWVQVSGMAFFATAFTLAVVNIQRSDWHKRLMVLGTVSLLDAPIARWFAIFLAPPNAPLGPPPVFVTIPPAIVADLLLVAAIVYDWRVRGRPHPVYLIGGAVLLMLQLTRVPISETAAWQAIAVWLQHLGG